MKDDKSKSQAKRDAKALQDLGKNLVELSNHQLAKIPLPETLLAAIVRVKKINSFVAKKRGIQTIGGFLRNVEDIVPIQEAYDKIIHGSKTNTAQFHLIETWRTRLMSDDNTALTAFIEQYPCDNSQTLRHLIRKAKSERDHQKDLGAAKTLFRFIREHIS